MAREEPVNEQKINQADVQDVISVRWSGNERSDAHHNRLETLSSRPLFPYPLRLFGRD